MSYKMVLVESNGHECGNACRFKTAIEAGASFRELAGRWMGCPGEYFVEECDEPVNYAMVDGRPKSL